MPTPRPIPIVLAVLVSTVGEIAAVAAQTSPEPAKASPAPVKAAPIADIVFYLARGETDACGRGCSTWIAADGKIDPGAAQRLRRLLAKLGNRRPPIYFHSPGGSVVGAIELGRLIRGQKLEVSVGHTIPRGCDRDKPLDNSCEALKRSGQELEADFDPTVAMCNSSCVYPLAGGTTRFVPPGVKLGIHDVGLDPDKPKLRGAAAAEGKRLVHARIQEYLRDMGIDKALLTAASAIPFESARFLERDELVRFGIDRREFGETVWHFTDKSIVAMSKQFFVRTDNGDQPRYRNGFLSLGCGVGQEIRLAFAQEHDPSEQKSTDPVRINVDGQRIALRYQVPSREFVIRSTALSADMLDVVRRSASIKVSGIAQGRNDESAGSVTLNMDGFSDASVKLRKSCDESARHATAVAPPPASAPGPPLFGVEFPAALRKPAAQSPAVAQNAPAAPIPPRPPQTLELTRVVAGELRVRLDFLYSIEPDCSSAGPTTVRVIEQARHGMLAIEKGEGFTNFPKDNQRYECNTRRSDGTLVFYEPNADYTGADSITLYVIYPTGTAQTRHYSVEVK